MTLNTAGVIQFRLMGRTFKMSITEFNMAIGFIDERDAQLEMYLTSACDYDNSFHPVLLYLDWSTSSH